VEHRKHTPLPTSLPEKKDREKLLRIFPSFCDAGKMRDVTEKKIQMALYEENIGTNAMQWLDQKKFRRKKIMRDLFPIFLLSRTDGDIIFSIFLQN
jgi:hypothetical protein